MEALAAVVSAIVGLLGLMAGAVRWRESALRREEVLAWAQDGIRALQSLHLITVLGPSGHSDMIRKLIFDSSSLIEIGRMFFRNEPYGDFGSHKPPAYRGLRPIILDQLVIGHQIACRIENADAETLLRMRAVAEDALRWFVSYAQQEVGRNKPASKKANEGGDGIDIDHLLAEVDSRRLSGFKRRPYL